jgi:hypothetical protein
MMGETPWEAGRFDAKAGSKRILFGRMYEDAAIEQAAFARAERVFCIASAGCMALALAPRHQVTAVDINPVQLAYAQQRANGGPTQVGAAERIMDIGRRLAPLVGWRRQTVASFLALDDPEQQLAFWNQHLNTARFRIATDALFSRACLRSVYASPFLQFLPAHFGRVLRARLARAWQTHVNRGNPYARALLLGETPTTPPSPDAEHVRFLCADAAGFLESCAPESFDAFTLSNILDGAPAGYRERLQRAVRHAGTPDSIVVRRSFAEPTDAAAANQARQDRSILWGVVDVHPIHHPAALRS